MGANWRLLVGFALPNAPHFLTLITAPTITTLEIPVATKLLGEDRNVKSEITGRSVPTPQ